MAGSAGTRKTGLTMRTAMLPLIAAFELAGRIVFAQTESNPAAQLRACSMMERTERLECLDRLSRDIAGEPDRPAGAAATG